MIFFTLPFYLLFLFLLSIINLFLYHIQFIIESGIYKQLYNLFRDLNMSGEQQRESAYSKEQVKDLLGSSVVNSIFKVKQNHLSSSHQNLLKYEQKNFEIQYLTRKTQIKAQAIERQMKKPLVPSVAKGKDIFQKYGSMIQNQPMFLRQLIYNKYLSYLPQKFQNQFSQIMVIGSCFQAVWWGSLAAILLRAYKRRHMQVTSKERAMKGMGVAFVFLASSISFHEQFYIPAIKECLYHNIKSFDSLMDSHLKVLKLSGASFQQQKGSPSTGQKPQQIQTSNKQTKTSQPSQALPHKTKPHSSNK